MHESTHIEALVETLIYQLAKHLCFCFLPWSLQEGLSVDWSAGWKAKLPLLSEKEATTEVEVPFEAHQLSATSKTQNVDRFVETTFTPITRVKAIATYLKGVLTLSAVLTVQTTYTNGAIQTCNVPAKYTGVSCHNVDISLENI